MTKTIDEPITENLRGDLIRCLNEGIGARILTWERAMVILGRWDDRVETPPRKAWSDA